MKTLRLLAIVLFCAVSGCRRDEKEFVRDTATRVGAGTLLADAAMPTNPRDKHEYQPFDPSTFPKSFAAFNPIEVVYGGPESILIVTARTVQHRTGLYIAHPDEVVPKSTKYQTYDPISPRLYFYQD
jgi:hypothetical protein